MGKQSSFALVMVLSQNFVEQMDCRSPRAICIGRCKRHILLSLQSALDFTRRESSVSSTWNLECAHTDFRVTEIYVSLITPLI